MRSTRLPTLAVIESTTSMCAVRPLLINPAERGLFRRPVSRGSGVLGFLLSTMLGLVQWTLFAVAGMAFGSCAGSYVGAKLGS